MRKFLWLYFTIFFSISCSGKSIFLFPAKIESKPSMLRLMTYLMNLQTYGLPAISTNISSDGKTILVERLDHQHRVIREDLYFDGKIVSSAQFKYDKQNNIIESLNYDDQGELILHQTFLYQPNNSLWQIFQQDRTSLYQKNYAYTDDNQNSLIIDYFQQGMLAGTMTYHAQLLSRQKNYFYQQGYLIKETSKNLEDQSEHIAYYNQDQILTAVTFLRNNEFIEHEEYFYQGKKLIRKTVENQEGQIIEYLYHYDENGILTKTDLYQDNTLRQSKTYLTDGKYIIEYYALGQIRMSELYENNTLVKQEIFDIAITSDEGFLD